MKSINELDLKNKKVIIFDVDCTLIDSIGIWNKTDSEMIEKYGRIKVDEDIIQRDRDNFLSNNNDKDIYIEYCNYLIEKYNMNITKDEFLKERYGSVQDYFVNKMDYKEYVDKVINKLYSLGYTLCIGTTTTKNQIDTYANKNIKMKEKVDLYKCFDYIVTKEDIKNKKPNPEVYLNILNHYDIDPKYCLVFEDSIAGIKASKSAGIEVVNIYDVYADNDREEIDKLTDYKIDSFKEILDLIEFSLY